MPYEFERTHRLAVLGGGPGGYEAALTGAQLGADVTLVERAGVGGAAVLTDVVPSKTLIATAEAATAVGEASDLGVQFFTRNDKGRPVRPEIAVNLGAVNKRLLALAQQQSADMKAALARAGVRIVQGDGRLEDATTIIASTGRGKARTDFDEITADTLVVAVDSDRLFLPAQSARVAAGVPHARPLQTLHTPYGHDGFLIEHDQLGPLVRAHLEG